MRRIKNLKEEKSVIRTFNDDEVRRILRDVEEETYSNVRDKFIIIGFEIIPTLPDFTFI